VGASPYRLSLVDEGLILLHRSSASQPIVTAEHPSVSFPKDETEQRRVATIQQPDASSRPSSSSRES